ncbi:MAG: enoyl-CoA hydratase/isomerase family protein [Microthrixaceae bacterium]
MTETLTLGEGTVRLERADGIATITLDRPEVLNAINAEMWHGLLSAFRLVADEPEDRCVVLTGSGRAFCSGADLSDAAGGKGAAGMGRSNMDNMRKIAEVCLAVHECPTPVVARVQGIAAGAGCNLALAADIVLAGPDARFSEIFARRGLSVDFGGSWLLPRLVGLQRAKELVLLAEVIDAAEAHRMGLVNRVAADLDGLDEEVRSVARRLADGPPIALAASKRLLQSGWGSSLSEALEAESNAQCVNFSTKDTVEAVSAFLEKREPRFTGR